MNNRKVRPAEALLTWIFSLAICGLLSPIIEKIQDYNWAVYGGIVLFGREILSTLFFKIDLESKIKSFLNFLFELIFDFAKKWNSKS